MKRRAEKQITQLDDGDEESNDDQGAGFRRATENELAARPMKGLPKRQRAAPAVALETPTEPTGTPKYADTSVSDMRSSEDKTKRATSFSGFGAAPLSSQAFTAPVPAANATAWTLSTFPSGPSENPKAATSSENAQLSQRPGSPVWDSPTARQEFYKRPLEIQHELARDGLNLSFVKALQNLVDLHPALDLKATISPLLDIYERHKQAIDQKYKIPDSKSVSSSLPPLGRTVEAPAVASTTAKPPIPSGFAMPAPPSSQGGFTFGGKTLDFSKLATPSSSAPSTTVASLPGLPTVHTGGFTFGGKPFGAPTATSSTSQTTPAAFTPSETSTATSSGDVPMDEPQAASEPVPSLSAPTTNVPTTSAPTTGALDETNSSAKSSTPNPVAPKLSPFSAFATSTRPKNSSPLASQPPISSSPSVKPTSSPELSPSSAKLASKFSPTSPIVEGLSPATQAAMSAKSPFPSSAPFGLSSASSKPPSISFGTPGASFGTFGSASGSTSFGGFGTPKFPLSTGFSFGSAPPAVSSSPDKDKPSDSAVAEMAQNASQQSSHLSGTFSDASSLVPSQGVTPEPDGEGEENEITVYQTKSKLYKAVPNEGSLVIWTDMGTGWVRLKKDKDTSKRRILFRQEGTSRLQLNFYIYPSLVATIPQNKVVAFTGLDGTTPMSVRLKCKTNDDAERLKTALLAEVEAVIAGAPGLNTPERTADAGKTDTDKTQVLDNPQVEEAPAEHAKPMGAPEESFVEGDAGDGEEEYDEEIEEMDPYEEDYRHDGQGEEDELEESDGGAERHPEVVELLDDDDEE